MALERSHGRLRPTLPRSSDLAVPQATPDRRQGRDERGRFAPGHRSGARGKGWQQAIRRLAHSQLDDPELRGLANDAGSLFRARLHELPDRGPTISALVAEGARSSVLSARFAARAVEIGLDTDDGRRALELSMRLGQRAERSSVTALDVATRLAEARRRDAPDWLTTWRSEPENEPDVAETTESATDAPDAENGQPAAANGAE
jgi:hypothetical protein